MACSVKSDVILEVDGHQYHCSKSVLSSKSPYFEAMFSGFFKEKSEDVIVLQGVSPSAMKVIVNSLEEQSLHIEESDLVSTLQAACMLQFDDIRKYAIRTLIEILNYDNCFPICFMAHQLDIKPLYQKALCIALMEFRSVVETKDFLELDLDHLHSYLANSSLFCESEVDVFEAGMKWWYEHEQTCKKCTHEYTNNSAATADQSDAQFTADYCTTVLLIILSCIDYNNIKISDLRLMLTYPGLNKHSIVEKVLRCVICMKRDTEDGDFNQIIHDYAKDLINCERRCIAKVPCIVGFVKRTEMQSENKSFKRNYIEKTHLMYYDEEKNSVEVLFPLKHVGEGEGPDLEGYKVEVWKNKILLLGGEFMYGFGNWSTSCWMFDTAKSKWSRFTTLPSNRRHFKTCIVNHELFIIGGTGKYRVIQNNMDVYNLKTETWIKGIQFPHELRDIECCEFQNKLFIICGGRSAVETFLFYPEIQSWVALTICDPNQLYKVIEQQASPSRSNSPRTFQRYIPYTIGDDLYINGNYLLGLKLNQLNLEVFYFGAGLGTNNYAGSCIINDKIYSFESVDVDFSKSSLANYITLFCIKNKENRKIEVTDLNIRFKQEAGCFGLYHHNLVSLSNCISECKINWALYL